MWYIIKKLWPCRIQIRYWETNLTTTAQMKGTAMMKTHSTASHWRRPHRSMTHRKRNLEALSQDPVNPERRANWSQHGTGEKIYHEGQKSWRRRGTTYATRSNIIAPGTKPEVYPPRDQNRRISATTPEEETKMIIRNYITSILKNCFLL